MHKYFRISGKMQTQTAVWAKKGKHNCTGCLQCCWYCYGPTHYIQREVLWSSWHGDEALPNTLYGRSENGKQHFKFCQFLFENISENIPLKSVYRNQFIYVYIYIFI